MRSGLGLIATTCASLAVMWVLASGAWAQTTSATLTILSGGAAPPITVAAGQVIQLTVVNSTSTGVELDGVLFPKPAVLNAGASAVFAIGPLVPGTYDVIDDLHPATPAGVVIAK